MQPLAQPFYAIQLPQAQFQSQLQPVQPLQPNAPQHPLSQQPSIQPTSQPSEQASFPSTLKVQLVPYLPPQFQFGLCDCCLDKSLCLHGCFCPCHLFGKNVEHFANESCCGSCCCYVIGCGLCHHAPYRRKLRLKYNLKEAPCDDCLVVLCCSCCALCQEHKEIMYQMQHSKFKAPIKQSMDD